MRLILRAASILIVLTLPVPSTAAAQAAVAPPNSKHDSEQWKMIEKHLPDPATATSQTLETEGDILRVRKFPEDAISYYQYALVRGGNVPHLLNKMGLAELELRNNTLARMYFQRAVKINKKDPEAWNNLGAVEYLNGSIAAAVSDYKKAVKLDKEHAVYHANLATAYFDRKQYDPARREISEALRIDPQIFERRPSNGGVAAHVLSSQERARFSYEMAKMYARSGMEEQMLHSLAMASEAGMDIQAEMRKDPVLVKLVDDPRIVVVVKNAEALRSSRTSGAAPPLPSNTPVSE